MDDPERKSRVWGVTLPARIHKMVSNNQSGSQLDPKKFFIRVIALSLSLSPLSVSLSLSLSRLFLPRRAVYHRHETDEDADGDAK